MSLVSQGAELAQPGAAPLAHAQPSVAGVEDFLALMNYRDGAEPFEGLRSATA